MYIYISLHNAIFMYTFVDMYFDHKQLHIHIYILLMFNCLQVTVHNRVIFLLKLGVATF